MAFMRYEDCCPPAASDPAPLGALGDANPIAAAQSTAITAAVGTGLMAVGSTVGMIFPPAGILVTTVGAITTAIAPFAGKLDRSLWGGGKSHARKHKLAMMQGEQNKINAQADLAQAQADLAQAEAQAKADKAQLLGKGALGIALLATGIVVAVKGGRLVRRSPLAQGVIWLGVTAYAADRLGFFRWVPAEPQE